MVKIKFANLVNLILDREVIPEMLQRNCTANKIFICLKKLITEPNFAQKQINESAPALKMLGLGVIENPSAKAAVEILKLQK
jgi:lipid-A-disaccharide synthase